MNQPQANGKPAALNGSARASGLRILVVDDSATIRRSAETMLTAEGHEVVVPLAAAGLPFGAGAHRCPGADHARALACGVVEAVLASGLQPAGF